MHNYALCLAVIQGMTYLYLGHWTFWLKLTHFLILYIAFFILSGCDNIHSVNIMVCLIVVQIWKHLKNVLWNTSLFFNLLHPDGAVSISWKLLFLMACLIMFCNTSVILPTWISDALHWCNKLHYSMVGCSGRPEVPLQLWNKYVLFQSLSSSWFLWY